MAPSNSPFLGRGRLHQRQQSFQDFQWPGWTARDMQVDRNDIRDAAHDGIARSEEHTSELQSLMRISYAVFCLKKKNKEKKKKKHTQHIVAHNEETKHGLIIHDDT